MNSNYINRRYFSIVAVPSYTHKHTHTHKKKKTHTHTHKDFTIVMNSKSFAHRLNTNKLTTMWVAKTSVTVRLQVGLACSNPEQFANARVML